MAEYPIVGEVKELTRRRTIHYSNDIKLDIEDSNTIILTQIRQKQREK